MISLHLTFTRSKPIIETLEKGEKYKVNNKNTRKRHWHRSGVSIFNFEYIFLVFLLFILNK